ncbi:hypothetical protein Hypma_002135 [Hypsizygus marmoreus]|uniref:Uncharacterized protein n=1 Tax=Hypsizygus marmoreus TaxID=39966 RepID=A0A369KAA2_HYPMA|nr:hypothetical protein Hypma_002135 [Hypsizygus marmoreus]
MSTAMEFRYHSRSPLPVCESTPDLDCERSFFSLKDISAQILTFSDRGISGHPNYKSLPKCIQHVFSHPGHFRSSPSQTLYFTYGLCHIQIHKDFNTYLVEIHPILKSASFLFEVQVVRSARDLGLGFNNPSISKPAMHVMAPVAIRGHASQLVCGFGGCDLFSRYM